MRRGNATRPGNTTLPDYLRERLDLVTRMVGDVGEDTGYLSEVLEGFGGGVEGAGGPVVAKVVSEMWDGEEICKISEEHDPNPSHSSASILQHLGLLHQYLQTAPPFYPSVFSYSPPDFSAFPAFPAFLLPPFPALHTTLLRLPHVIPGL